MSDAYLVEKQEELEIASQQKDSRTKNQTLNILNDQNERSQQEQQPLHLQDGQDEPSMVTIPEKEEIKFYPYYHGEKSWILSKFLFIHLTQYSLFLKKYVLDKGYKISEKHLPQLSCWEDIRETVSDSQKKVNQINKITCTDLVKIIFFGQLKWISIGCFFSNVLEAIIRNGVSMVMSKVITSAQNDERDNVYWFATLLVFLNLLCVFTRHHSYNLAMIFSSKARLTLINLVYIKLTELSAFSIKDANIGKIFNLISGDINYLEFVLIMVFQSSVCFISIIFGCYILWDRFSGPIGMIALAIIFIAYPIQILLQSFNSETLKTSKQYQDQRLKLTNELIEGIRLIKMYAWEQAFNKMISIMRQKEYICLLKINFRSAIDRLFSLISQVWSSFIFFIILYYGGFRQTMSVAEMISTIQLLTFFKISCASIAYILIQFSSIWPKVFVRFYTQDNLKQCKFNRRRKMILSFNR